MSRSFIGTTADSIKFANGFKFNASDATPLPLLTMSLPVSRIATWSKYRKEGFAPKERQHSTSLVAHRKSSRLKRQHER